MHTKPQLEIYADDVKCSHGATIGQLDQNALFYMRTRGVSEKDARMLLMQAFMADVVDCVRLDALRDRLRLQLAQLEGRLLDEVGVSFRRAGKSRGCNSMIRQDVIHTYSLQETLEPCP